jgi:phosphoglycolate phosphatase
MTRRAAGNVLLDLDGTLSDPKDGIFAAYRHALSVIGRPCSADDDLRWIIGPPLKTVFLQHLGDETLMLQALAHYREHYGVHGLYDSVPYPGALETVRNLRAEGYRIFLATSKLTTFATRILEHFGIVDQFDGIYGSQPDGSYDQKADLIALIMRHEGLDAASCVMAGDRKHDVIGARANDVVCIGAAWGYGQRAELQAAGATAICDSPAALPDCIRLVMGKHWATIGQA